ncbi:MAG: hypothetical protein KDD35_09175 [Bdellovibrionales bacterium]|nr:hypothetical protein [Bdellovibrionales bacterium]
MPAKAERRSADRKSVGKIEVAEVTSLSNYKVLIKKGIIVDASITGLLIRIERADLVPDELKSNLTLDSIVGQQIVLFLPQMNLDLDGTVNRTHHKGKGVFEVAIVFSDDVPEYWRECLIDLLPSPGELETDRVENQ